MKVVCIRNNTWAGGITIGKIYDVIKLSVNDGDYIIKNDRDEIWHYPKKWFKLLSEIRNETIDKLLGE